MPESMKNRDILPIGTRVRPAYDKLSTRVGTVIGYETEKGREDRMVVQWDDQKYPQSGYSVPEIRPAREGE